MSDVHWAVLGAFWVSIAAALIAFGASLVNYHFFRSQIDPLVIVYATADEEHSGIINLVIENIGKGLAKNVAFELSRSIPEHAFGTKENASVPNIMSNGPLINGIPALGPGAKRIITWGEYWGLEKGIGENVVIVTVRFRGDPIGPFDPVWHEIQCPLEIKSFQGTDASDRNWEKQSANQLKKIAEILRLSASGVRPLTIKMQDRKPHPAQSVQPRNQENEASGGGGPSAQPSDAGDGGPGMLSEHSEGVTHRPSAPDP